MGERKHTLEDDASLSYARTNNDGTWPSLLVIHFCVKRYAAALNVVLCGTCGEAKLLLLVVKRIFLYTSQLRHIT